MINSDNTEFYHTFDITDIARYIKRNSDSEQRSDAVFYEIDGGDYKLQAPVRLLGLTIALCLEGEGELSIGVKSFKCSKNSLILLNPNQYVHSLRTFSPLKFMLIGCNVEILQTIVPKLSGFLSLMIHNPMESVTMLTDLQTLNIKELMKYVGKKLEAPETPIKKTKIRSLLQALLCEIIEIHYGAADGMVRFQTRKEEIFTKFVSEVINNFKSERSVSFYADRLCVTPKHLSAVVKEITRHTAGELIDHYVIMEAKVMLAESSLTIQEVANKLNFANQSFFGKYFKHLTGFSPSAFRKMTSI